MKTTDVRNAALALEAAQSKWDGGPAGCEMSDAIAQHLDTVVSFAKTASDIIPELVQVLSETWSELYATRMTVGSLNETGEKRIKTLQAVISKTKEAMR